MSDASLDRFRREYLGEFLERTPEEERALWIACWYETTRETFDRAVCTGGVHHELGALPATPHERGLINRHARECRLEAGRMAVEREVPQDVLTRAIRDAQRLPPAEQAAIVARPPP